MDIIVSLSRCPGIKSHRQRGPRSRPDSCAPGVFGFECSKTPNEQFQPLANTDTKYLDHLLVGYNF